MADAGTSGGLSPPPPSYKFIGLGLAITSGIFIGSSFVIKKEGLLRANEVAGEGHAYLKSTMWWSGMIIMLIGEIFNFVAYSFAPALLVTPLGALSVVVCAVLSSFILKEQLNLHGKIGCILCIIGAIIIVMHSPQQAAVTDIDQFKHFVLQPGFLVYAGLVVVICSILIFKVAPKYGKTHLLVYITVCSLIGSLSVVATQGLGAAIVLNITTGTPQFNQWFIYVVLVVVICTLVTEINYLNKALNLFNTSVVTPIYYVMFTSSTIVASVILFQGFSASAVEIMTVVMGFSVICAGVVLLQTSKDKRGGSTTDNGRQGSIGRSKSSLTIDLVLSAANEDTHGIGSDNECEPGPSGLRGFDSIRRLSKEIRSNTAGITPGTAPNSTSSRRQSVQTLAPLAKVLFTNPSTNNTNSSITGVLISGGVHSNHVNDDGQQQQQGGGAGLKLEPIVASGHSTMSSVSSDATTISIPSHMRSESEKTPLEQQPQHQSHHQEQMQELDQLHSPPDLVWNEKVPYVETPSEMNEQAHDRPLRLNTRRAGSITHRNSGAPPPSGATAAAPQQQQQPQQSLPQVLATPPSLTPFLVEQQQQQPLAPPPAPYMSSSGPSPRASSGPPPPVPARRGSRASQNSATTSPVVHITFADQSTNNRSPSS